MLLFYELWIKRNNVLKNSFRFSVHIKIFYVTKHRTVIASHSIICEFVKDKLPLWIKLFCIFKFSYSCRVSSIYHISDGSLNASLRIISRCECTVLYWNILSMVVTLLRRVYFLKWSNRRIVLVRKKQ